MSNWKPIDGRIVSIPAMQAIVASTQFVNWRPSGGALHNTAVPSLKRSKDYPIEHWRDMWVGYYRGLGWSGGPHFFCFPGQVLLFTPVTLPGVHSPSWNGTKFGVEMVLDADKEPVNSGDGLKVVQAAVAVFAAMYARLGLDPQGIKLHKEDPRTTHACPGKFIEKNAFIEQVQEQMGEAGEHTPPAIAVLAPTDEIERGAIKVALNDHLNMRVNADAKSSVLLQLFNGNVVEIHGEAMNGTTRWLRVSAQNQTGWVNAKFVVENAQ